MVSVKQIDRLRICCTYMISAAKKNSDVDVPKKYFSYDYAFISMMRLKRLVRI